MSGWSLTRNTTEIIRLQNAKPRPKFNQGRTAVCDYVYRRPDGTELFFKRRYKLDEELWGRPKDFRIYHRPIPEEPQRIRVGVPVHIEISDWLYRLDDLYRVAEAGGDAYVHWTEGEKDADMFWERGIPATTNAMGASKAATHAQAMHLLPFETVFVWADKDPVGYWNAVTRYNAMVSGGRTAATVVLRRAGAPYKDIGEAVSDVGWRKALYGAEFLSPKELGVLASAYDPAEGGSRWGYDG